jgi:putative nucleotidyltransferase with HDIG domain
MISIKEALGLIKGTSRYSHALAVAAMMKALAGRLGKNEELWELVGLLHDLDYDDTRSDMSKHGLVAAKMLKGRLPEHELYAIKAHDYRTGFKPRTSLDCALVATDTLAVFLEKTKKVTTELTVESVLPEIDSASESQPWIKSNLRKCKAMKIGLNEFLEVCLSTIK